ncbi:MAG: hypothetical protein MSA82_08430 [Oscillospiraceae bacterium]|nr:hypothetical protein [Oscillospiraceae bacterium]
MANNSFIKLDLSGGWYDVLKESIAMNTRQMKVSGTGDDDAENEVLIYRNGRITEKLEHYIREDGTISIFSSELKVLFWILMENIVYLLADYMDTLANAKECVNMMNKYKELLDTIIDEYGLEIDED